jgi:diguanylate cyclase (GGDEF)-like protein
VPRADDSTILLLHWLPAAIRERQAAERTADGLRVIASHDGLTGLFNRSQFLTLGEAEWNRAQRYGRPLAMLMLDIDLFKSVNDCYGHDAGDQVISQIAKVCRDCSRSADIAARLGGEEFAVLLPETERDAAGILAERLRQAVEDLRISANSEQVPVTISVGISAGGSFGSFSALIKAADVALYEAKHAGRNRVCYFDRHEAVMP